MTLQAGSSALPPLEVVVMAAVLAMSSMTSLHSCVKESQRDVKLSRMRIKHTSPVTALHSQ